MRRFLLLLTNEFKLARTAIPIHIVAVLQPTVMYLLMTVILVHPTFDMNMIRPATNEGRDLLAAMNEVGSPIGEPYIKPIMVDSEEAQVARQVVSVESVNSVPTAIQRYGLIDSNIVKNYRNRLTAAALRVWNKELGDRAVTIREHPWLSRDVPYTVYFGMALLPMTVFLAASIVGSVLTAQEFEFQTILEYRLAPAPVALVLGARLARLALTGLLSAGVLLVTVGLITGAWPDSAWQVGLILLPVAISASCLGVIAGLLLRRLIPAFLVGLVSSFVLWIVGSAFGLAAGFGGAYKFFSRLTPNTHAVELVFPHYYYGTEVGAPLVSSLVLVLFSAGFLALAVFVYRWRVLQKG